MIKAFFQKHESFFSTIWHISLVLGYLYAFYRWIVELFLTAHEGNFFGFMFLFVLQTLILGLNGIISALFFTLFLSILGFVPYLVIRGLAK